MAKHYFNADDAYLFESMLNEEDRLIMESARDYAQSRLEPRALEEEADQVICLRTPVAFGAVGTWYEDFAPVFDSEVKKLLDESDGDA